MALDLIRFDFFLAAFSPKYTWTHTHTRALHVLHSLQMPMHSKRSMITLGNLCCCQLFVFGFRCAFYAVVNRKFQRQNKMRLPGCNSSLLFCFVSLILTEFLRLCIFQMSLLCFVCDTIVCSGTTDILTDRYDTEFVSFHSR